MAITQTGDVFVPQVVGDLATDILFKRVPLLASGYVQNAADTIWSEGGSTVTFPFFDTTVAGIVQDQIGNNRAGVTPSKISMGSYSETLESKIISIDISKHVLQDAQGGRGNINAHMAQVVAKESASAIQTLLVSKAGGTSLELDVTGETTKTLTVDAIGEAKMKRGEYAADGMPALFVHSKQATDLMKSKDFKALGSAATTALVNAGVQNAVGIVHGVLVVIMDSVAIAAGPPPVYTGLMVWPDALGLYIKQDIESKTVEHAGSNVSTYDFDFRYAGTLYRNAPRGVVKLVTQ